METEAPPLRTELPSPDDSESGPWLQVHCALFTNPSGTRPATPWHELAAVLEEWRGASLFHRFFFMRKPPGLRLRWQGPEVHDILQPQLKAWLAGLEEVGVIRSFSFPPYQPEVDRFGGPVGMDIAHEHFDEDSAIALAYEALDDRRRGEVSRHVISAAICSDLFRRALNDRQEIAGAWTDLASDARDLLIWLGRQVPQEESNTERLKADLVKSAVALADPFWAALSPDVAALVRRAIRANERTAAGVRMAGAAGRLSIDRRSWLVSAATFHRNRMGLGLEPEELAAITIQARDACA